MLFAAAYRTVYFWLVYHHVAIFRNVVLVQI